MPRRREKTRVEHLAEALMSVETLAVHLNAVDLRTTSGDLRQLVKESRGLADELGTKLAAAVRADLPVGPQGLIQAAAAS